ncbi:MAG: gliding motility-associated-like protein, partial [bacterium]
CSNSNVQTVMPVNSGGSFTVTSYTTASGQFDPSLAAVGLNKVVYTITNAAGCRSVDFIDIEVLVIPQNKITLDPHEGCEPLGVFVSSERMGGEDSVIWFVNGQRTTDTYNFFGTYNRGIYQVRFNVYGINGCNIQKDTSFEVFAKPVADFTYSPTDIYITEPDVQFTDRSTANVVAWDWDFGDATNSSDEDPLYVYAEAGQYLVQLFVTSGNGCLDTALQTLIIKDEILLFIPNAISPNDDGLNDVFRVVGLGYTHIDMLIFNRWGEQIYQSDEFVEWDGTYNGEKVQMGSYPYIMNIVDNRGRKYHEVGEVQVVR